MQKNYLNLTNGIDYLPYIDKNIPFGFIRIQSTTIENKDWLKLLGDLDHDLLLHLALGVDCTIYDKGTNRNLSKTIYYGVPLIKYILNRFWYGKIDSNINRYNRDGIKTYHTYDAYFSLIYAKIFDIDITKEKLKIKKKFKYYKKFLNSNEVLLKGTSTSTTNDGDYDYHSKILKQWFINKKQEELPMIMKSESL